MVAIGVMLLASVRVHADVSPPHYELELDTARIAAGYATEAEGIEWQRTVRRTLPAIRRCAAEHHASIDRDEGSAIGEVVFGRSTTPSSVTITRSSFRAAATTCIEEAFRGVTLPSAPPFDLRASFRVTSALYG